MLSSNNNDWYVAIAGCGAQGLEDLHRLVISLPATPDAVVLCVLHDACDLNPPMERLLQHQSPMPVRLARAGEALHPGTLYIATPPNHLELLPDKSAGILCDPASRFQARTIDLLLNSVAAVAGRRAIGVLLSGAIEYGYSGLGAIRAAGGVTMKIAPQSDDQRVTTSSTLATPPVNVVGNSPDLALAILQTTNSAGCGKMPLK